MHDKISIRAFALSATLLLGILTSNGHASELREGDINTGYFGNVAIKGYDPVAYFTEKKPVVGKRAHSHDWLGATWHFASAKHRDMFISSPTRYAPQYGGYCAGGLALGERNFTTNIDPEAWRIVDGKLYLSYDHGSAMMIEEKTELLEEGQANWVKIRARKAKKN